MIPDPETFTIPDTEIKVTLVNGLKRGELMGFGPFKNWLQTIQSSLALQHTTPTHPFHTTPYTLHSITINTLTRFTPTKIGFMYLTTDLRTSPPPPEKPLSLPGAVFLRGASVAMLVILQPDDLEKADEREKHVLMTIQARPAAGSLGFCELPAGMVDEGSFKGAAAKEMEEELGMRIEESELVDLGEMALAGEGEDGKGKGVGSVDGEMGGLNEGLQKAMYPSAGGCDEYIKLYLCEKRVPRHTLKEWEGKLTGLREEGERITLKLVPLQDLWREGARDSKALSAWALWEGLKRTGKL